MSTIINGTSNAITFPDSTIQTTAFTATPALTSVTTTGGANFATSSGNVGVGTASPAYKLDVVGDSRITASSNTNGLALTSAFDNTGLSLISTSTGGATWKIMSTAGGSGYGQGSLAFEKDASLKMLLDSSGNVLINQTSVAHAGKLEIGINGGAYNAIIINDSLGSGTAYPQQFYRSNTVVGSISTTASSTAYNTSSDYRLKDNVVPMTGALEKVAKLKPVTYSWKVDGSDGEGFIAHELAEVAPQAVSGEKDAVDAEGNPKYQGVDYSKLVATLTAAIQEQQVMIEELKAKVTALESK